MARILQILSVLDVEIATDELRLIPVRYADAVELARILNEFFSGRRVRTSVTDGARARPGAPAPRRRRPRRQPYPGPPSDSGDRPPLILADKRTNALIVSGRRSDVELASKLTGQLDVDTQANKRVFVYYVENVKAKELAATLTEIFGKPGEAGARLERRDQQPAFRGPGAGRPPGPPLSWRSSRREATSSRASSKARSRSSPTSPTTR